MNQICLFYVAFLNWKQNKVFSNELMVPSNKILWNTELPGTELRGRDDAERFFVVPQGDVVFSPPGSFWTTAF